MPGFVRVRTGGSHREMGFDLGRAVKDVLRELLAESARFYRRFEKHDAAFARRYAMRNFLPHVARRYPDYVEETRGLAEGAGLPFEDAFFISADEELSTLWEKKRKEKCSTAAVRSRRGLFLLHNEDYPPRYFGRLAVVEAEPDDAPAFLALTYPYVLAGPSCGMNAAGLAFACDSLNFPARAKGIPTNYVLRDLYRARRAADVRRIVAVPRALMGNAVTVVSAKEGTARAVEASPTATAVVAMGGRGLLAHTNHVVSRDLPRRGEKPTAGSKRRLAALDHALAWRAADADLAALEKALSSRASGLCRPETGPADSATIASAVLDPKRRVMYVAKRGPGGHDFRPYRLGTR